MDQIKVDNFVKENPDGTFPKYVALDKESCAEIRLSLSERLEIDVSSGSMVLVNAIDRLGEICGRFNCDDDELDLKKTLSSLEIYWPEYVFINWYRYDDIDKVKFSDLANHFDDVWYPNVDDIDIFDETFTWVLSLTHYGVIKILRV